MSLAVGVVSPEFAFLMSDGLVTSVEAGEVRVWETDHSKIYQLPSGDRLIALGNHEECTRLAHALQLSESVPVTVSAKRIEAWGNRRQCGRNYFALIGRQHNGRLYVWRGISSPEGWGANIAVDDFSQGSGFVVLCDGLLGSLRDEIGKEIWCGRIYQCRTFGDAVKHAHDVFMRIYRSGGEKRIGGEIFMDSFSATPTVSRELAMMFPRAATMETTTSRTSAVDSSGNLLLKNIAQGVASTAGPTTTSGTPSVIPEMSQTITTKGNKVLIVFNGAFQVSVLAGLLSIYLYRDGTSIGYVNLTSAPGASYYFPSSLSWIDSPSAASHTYDIRWTISSGTATSVGTDRALQVVEMG